MPGYATPPTNLPKSLCKVVGGAGRQGRSGAAISETARGVLLGSICFSMLKRSKVKFTTAGEYRHMGLVGESISRVLNSILNELIHQSMLLCLEDCPNRDSILASNDCELTLCKPTSISRLHMRRKCKTSYMNVSLARQVGEVISQLARENHSLTEQI